MKVLSRFCFIWFKIFDSNSNIKGKLLVDKLIQYSSQNLKRFNAKYENFTQFFSHRILVKLPIQTKKIML